MPTFTPEQETLFARRFEEKYDLADPLYSQWLKINHPQELQSTIEEDRQFENYIQEVVNNQGNLEQVEIINDVVATEPANLVDQSESTCGAESSRDQSTLNILNQSLSSTKASNENPSNVGQGITNLPTSTTPRAVAMPPPEHERELRYISPYLIQCSCESNEDFCCWQACTWC